MINNISWTGYWYATLLITAGYYLLVIILYFNWEIRQIISRNGIPKKELLQGNSNNKTKISSSAVRGNTDPSTLEINEETTTESLNNFLDEINAYFLQSGNKAGDKDKIISDLERIRRKYPPTKNYDHKDALKKHILLICENNCAVTLSEDDVERVWEG